MSPLPSPVMRFGPYVIIILISILIWGALIYLFVLLVRCLKKYLGSGVRKESAEAIRTLGETIRAQRARCGMTQELVAESLGVSRQAVSRWESGKADPSTANLMALAKLFGISPGELLQGGDGRDKE